MTPRRPLHVLSHVPVGLLGRVTQELPFVTVEQIPEEGAIPSDARGEVLLTQAWGAPNLGDAVGRGIRWVHAYGTGVERFPFALLGDRPLTCSRGASGVPISEWVLAAMLAAEKKLPETWNIHGPEDWRYRSLGGLHGRTVGIVGFGGIGREVARRALVFGMRVLALARTLRPSPIAGVEIVDHLKTLMAAADHLVIAAPDTSETHHMIDRASLAHAKRGMHLVNVSRGGLVDQDALREALDDDRIALASLDTVTPEPPPAGHWLYRHPRVRLSPHTSWSGPGALEVLLDPFIANLRHYAAGEPFEDRVDVALGY